jgi:hypothetical protein
VFPRHPGCRFCLQTGAWGSEKDRSGDLSRYPHQLQFYDLPPEDEVSLEEFERLAVDRLRSAAGQPSPAAANPLPPF